jgi:hypothetical protein
VPRVLPARQAPQQGRGPLALLDRPAHPGRAERAGAAAARLEWHWLALAEALGEPEALVDPEGLGLQVALAALADPALEAESLSVCNGLHGSITNLASSRVGQAARADRVDPEVLADRADRAARAALVDPAAVEVAAEAER